MSLLGQRLRQEREARGLALLQVEIDTRIRSTVIQSLEEGNLESLPPEPFLRGLIRSYANYLRIDPQEMLDLYAADTVPAPPPELAPRPPVIKRPIAAPHIPAARPGQQTREEPTRPAAPPPEQPAIQRPAPTLPAPTAPSRLAERLFSALQPRWSEPVPPAPPTNFPEQESPMLASPPPDQDSPDFPSQLPEQEPPAPAPAAAPAPSLGPRLSLEPFKALRRRLPLAPPSAKPANPVLRPANPEPPPSVPPEILPPPEYIPSPPMPVVEELPEPVEPVQPIVEELPEPAEPVQPIVEELPEPIEPVKPVIDEQTDIPEYVPADSAEPASENAISEQAHDDAAPSKPKIRIELPKKLSDVPVPIRVAMAIVGLVIVGALVVLAYPSISPSVSFLAIAQPTATPTRIPRTPTPTVVPGSTPTMIPVIEATAVPFTPIANVPTQAPTKAGATSHPPDAGVPLTIDIDTTQPITAQIGIDGALVFNAPIPAGTSLTWVAREALYIRVENFVGAAVSFNGRKQVPMNFGERSVFERQWTVGSNGKVVAAAPVAPKAVTSTPGAMTLPPTNTPKAPPSPTGMPSADSATPGATSSPSTTPRGTVSPASTTSSATPTRVSPTSTPAGPTPTLTPFS